MTRAGKFARRGAGGLAVPIEVLAMPVGYEGTFPQLPNSIAWLTPLTAFFASKGVQ